MTSPFNWRDTPRQTEDDAPRNGAPLKATKPRIVSWVDHLAPRVFRTGSRAVASKQKEVTHEHF
jgi:hypothetical protein